MVLKAILKSACLIQATTFVEEQATVVALQLGKGRSNDSTLSANSKSSRRSKSTKSSEAASGDLEKKSKKRKTSKKHKSSKKSNTDKDEESESNEVCGTSCDWLNVFDSKTEEGKSDEAVMYRGCIIFWLTATLIPAVVGIVTCASGGSCMCCEETEMDKAVRMRKAEQAARSSAFESRGEENRSSNSNGAPVAAASPFPAASFSAAASAPFLDRSDLSKRGAFGAHPQVGQHAQVGVAMASAVQQPHGVNFAVAPPAVAAGITAPRGAKPTKAGDNLTNWENLQAADALRNTRAALSQQGAATPSPLPFVAPPAGNRPKSSCCCGLKGSALANAQYNWSTLDAGHGEFQTRYPTLAAFNPIGKKPTKDTDNENHLNAQRNYVILAKLSKGEPLTPNVTVGDRNVPLVDPSNLVNGSLPASQPDNPFVPAPWPVPTSCGRKMKCCQGPTKAMQNFTLLQDKHDAREWETPAQAAVVAGPTPVAGATVRAEQVPHAAQMGIPVDPAAAGGNGSPDGAAAAAVAGNNGQPGDDERPPGRCIFSRCCRGRSGRGRRRSAGSQPVMGDVNNGVNLAPQATQGAQGLYRPPAGERPTGCFQGNARATWDAAMSAYAQEQAQLRQPVGNLPAAGVPTAQHVQAAQAAVGATGVQQAGPAQMGIPIHPAAAGGSGSPVGAAAAAVAGNNASAQNVAPANGAPGLGVNGQANGGPE